MVWSQYVYEATVGLDAADDSGTDDADAPVANPPTIHDFQDTYSDELWYLFDIINTLIHDAFLEHDLRPRFDEFVELSVAVGEYYGTSFAHRLHVSATFVSVIFFFTRSIFNRSLLPVAHVGGRLHALQAAKEWPYL